MRHRRIFWQPQRRAGHSAGDEGALPPGAGGIVGPEASILCPIALLVVGLIFSFYYRENRYPTLQPRSLPASQDLAA